MRATKRALAEALRTDAAVLVPPAQIYAVERATVPVLPSIEVIGISTERVDSGPMARHEMSCEITVASATEDKADELLDGIVRAVRQRVIDAEHSARPIALASGEGCSVRAGRDALVNLGVGQCVDRHPGRERSLSASRSAE